jgi:hypothetical protein
MLSMTIYTFMFEVPFKFFILLAIGRLQRGELLSIYYSSDLLYY